MPFLSLALDIFLFFVFEQAWWWQVGFFRYENNVRLENVHVKSDHLSDESIEQGESFDKWLSRV